MFESNGIFADWAIFFGSNFLKIFLQAFGEISGNKPSATNNRPIIFKNTSTNYLFTRSTKVLKKVRVSIKDHNVVFTIKAISISL